MQAPISTRLNLIKIATKSQQPYAIVFREIEANTPPLSSNTPTVIVSKVLRVLLNLFKWNLKVRGTNEPPPYKEPPSKTPDTP